MKEESQYGITQLKRALGVFKSEGILPSSTPSKMLRFEGYIKTSNQRIMTTYRLPIVIEHVLQNGPSWISGRNQFYPGYFLSDEIGI